eukprot:2663308-Lingulodinium_polyedra.AAC.1
MQFRRLPSQFVGCLCARKAGVFRAVRAGQRSGGRHRASRIARSARWSGGGCVPYVPGEDAR